MTSTDPLDRLREIAEDIYSRESAVAEANGRATAARLLRFIADPASAEDVALAAYHSRRRRYAFGPEADPVMAPYYAMARNALSLIASSALSGEAK